MEVLTVPPLTVVSNGTTNSWLGSPDNGVSVSETNNNSSCDVPTHENILAPLENLVNSTLNNTYREFESHLLPSVHQSNKKKTTGKAFGYRYSKPFKYSNLHSPVAVQRSSPLLDRSPLKSPITIQPRSTNLKSKKAFVTQTKSNQSKYQYSRVPKSDSAYSEESCSPLSREFSPYSRNYSPVSDGYLSPTTSDLPHSYSQLATSSDSLSDYRFEYPEKISRSKSSYSEQYGESFSEHLKSKLLKSNSVILRSDSAFSDIECSYSTVPQSENDLRTDYSYSYLSKSPSTYSDNILLSNECGKVFPKSVSTYDCKTKSKNEYNKASEEYLDALVDIKDCNIIHDNPLIIPSSPSADIAPVMPTLKSFMKQPFSGLSSKKEDKPSPKRDRSLLSLSTSPKRSDTLIKKSQTLVTLSSVTKTNHAASTRLVDDCTNSCSTNGCLSQNLKHSLSQTFTQSIGNGLDILGNLDSSKKQKRRSYLPSNQSLSKNNASFSVTEGGDCDTVYCKVCLLDVSIDNVCQLTMCQCRFCKDCLSSYTSSRIQQGEYRIECPDGSCGRDEGSSPGEMTAEEIQFFAGETLFGMRNRYKLNAEVANDMFAVWCPKAGCETVVFLKHPKNVMPTQSSRNTTPLNYILSDSSMNFLTPTAVSGLEVNITDRASENVLPKSRFNDDKIEQDSETLNIVTNINETGNNKEKVDRVFESKPPKPTNLSLKPNNTVRDAISISPDNSLLMAASLNGLQSPAEYRPFAFISTSDLLKSNLAYTTENELMKDIRPDFPICPSCDTEFCPVCKMNSHPGQNCTVSKKKTDKMNAKKLKASLLGNELQGVIKSCPNAHCQVSIERNAGCAQMRCKACKHIFCWYCLASLEDDMFLRHYDKGPCRNKLGHSRASVFCHRLQLIAILVGVGLMVVAASPLMFLIAPCLLCEKCRRRVSRLEEDAL